MVASTSATIGDSEFDMSKGPISGAECVRFDGWPAAALVGGVVDGTRLPALGETRQR